MVMVERTDLVNSVADHDGAPLADLLVTLLASLTRVAHLGRIIEVRMMMS